MLYLLCLKCFQRLSLCVRVVRCVSQFKVPLLLSMKEEELALQKAINSEDTDLIYLTLIHLERSRPDPDTFYRLVHSHPEAANLLKLYYRNKVTSNDRTVLHNLLMHSKNYLEAGISVVTQAYAQLSPDSKLIYFREALQLFGQGRGDLLFLKTMTEEQIDLVDIQKTLEIRSDRGFIGLSLSETISNLVLLSTITAQEAAPWERELTKLVKKFKVSDKMLWHIKIQVYCRTASWDALTRLAAEKKSPVGYKPFALAAVK